MIQANTLVVKYFDSGNVETIHISLDAMDLESLANELNSAKERIRISRLAAEKMSMNFVVYEQRD